MGVHLKSKTLVVWHLINALNFICVVAAPPTDIQLINNQIEENKPDSTLIDTLSTIDPDLNDTFTYQFISGEGDTNNNDFIIKDNQLLSKISFDYNIRTIHYIRIQTTDSELSTYEKYFAIHILDINEPPAHLTLSSSSINEGQTAGTSIGTFSTTDPDAGDMFTYTLVSGAGSTDNASFEISGDILQSNAVFNYDTKSTYSIRVRTTDQGGLYFENTFTISVMNVNHPPENIQLTPNSINEGQDIGTTVGTLSTSDPDAGETFTYSLVSGTGSTDNSSFTISGNLIISAAVFNYDTKSNYSVRIRTTDQTGLFNEKAFTINVINVNRSPDNITLNPASINEGLDIGTTVGSLSSNDLDAGDTFTYTLVSGDGSADNAAFNISNNELKSALVFNYNTKNTYSIRIRTTDAGSLYFEKNFTVSITDINYSPANITLSSNTINEGLSVGTTVGSLTTTDPDTGDSFTYTFASGAGDTNNTSFNITGNSLTSKFVFDYNTKNKYYVRIRTTDHSGLYYEKYFTINVIDVNQTPTDISLSASSIAENLPTGTIVGSFTSTDPDINETFSYSLVSGDGSTDNSLFSISGSNLLTNSILNFEVKPTCTIRVRSTDHGLLSFEKVFTITILNVNEIPTDITLTPGRITENKPLNSLVGKFNTVDPDQAETFTYSLVSGTGSTDNTSFTITGNELRSNAIFNYEIKSSYNVRVRSSNSSVENYEKAFIILINDTSEAPTLTGIEASTLIYNEDEPAKTITQTIVVFDEDNSNLQSASVQITSNYISSEDSLYYTPVSGISVNYTNTGYLTATGSASLTAYQNFLKGVKYKNFNLANPSIDARTVRFLVNDGVNSSLPASRTIQVQRINDPPKAENLLITAANFFVGDLLTAQFSYTDPDGDIQGLSTFKWYTATSNTGLNKKEINGATSVTYLSGFNESGKYIGFSVTPVDNKGLVGTTANSSWYYINAAPIFTDSTIVNKSHPGIITINDTVTANFPFFDIDNDAAGNHNYQWYSSNIGNWSSAAPISGQTAVNLIITNSYKNKYIAVKAVPKAITGSPTGIEYKSSWYFVDVLPTATLSGKDTICKGGPAGTLNVMLTGTAPWSITYTINNTVIRTIRDIYTETGNYLLSAADSGSYTLVAVSDKKYSFGKVSGQGFITYFQKPTAKLTLPLLSICSNDTSTYTIPVLLTGKAPWNISYTINGRDLKTLTFLSAINAAIKVKYSTRGRYAITQVYDANCIGTVSGITDVSERTSPKAILSGDSSVCPYQAAMLHISLSGNGPWTFFYRKDNNPIDSVFVNQDINIFEYTVPIYMGGKYHLVGVKDEVQAGCVYGDATVSYYQAPTSTISGNLNICEGAKGSISVNLTGNPPWTFKYSLNGGVQTTISKITSTPYNLQVNKAGTYKIDSVRDGHCKGISSGSSNVNLVAPPEVSINGLDTVYTRETIIVPVYFEPPGGSYAESDKPDAFLSSEGITSFSPLLADTTDSPHWIRYKYQDPLTLCYGKDSIRVSIILRDAIIRIKDENLNKQEKLCFNQGPILIEGIKSNSDTGYFKIDATPEALVPAGPNTAYLLPDKIESGSRTVTFSYKVGGVEQTVSRNFTFEKLDADFDWDDNCYDDNTWVTLSDKTKFEKNSYLDHNYWNITYPSEVKVFSGSQVEVDFSNISSYPIDYIAVSNYGCKDTIQKTLDLKPTYKLIGSNYLETFSDGDGFWKSYPLNPGSVNTWELGSPSGIHFKEAPEARAWYTKTTNTSLIEHSYVESPCFNFEKSLRPMIKMNIWRGFINAPEIDGAALQYSTDNGLSWNLIGNVGEGINWYNSDDIDGAPGNQNTGWTKTNDFILDTNWIECRHSLDNLIGKSKVKFRIIYNSSNKPLQRDGFAFDNVWIGERTKRAVMEHFTNTGCMDCLDADERINSLANKYATDIIDLQYHLYEPETDTFYTLNPYPSFARELYYNIQNVPYSVMDGGGVNRNYNYLSKFPSIDYLDPIVLSDPVFDLNVNAEFAGNFLTIGVDIAALQHLDVVPLTVHVIVIENQIKGITGQNGETIFESIVHEMLPGTNGTSFERSWVMGNHEHINFDWELKNIFDRRQLRVVAFIQNEYTREIYQTSIDNPNIETDIKEYPDQSQDQFVVLPNPTSNYIRIYSKQPISQKTNLEISDNLGRIVWKGIFLPGEQEKTISLGGFEAGTYFLITRLRNQYNESHKIILLSN